MTRSTLLAAAVAAAVGVASLGACAAQSPHDSEVQACAELQPLLGNADRTPEQTRTAVTAVHGWSSQINGDDKFRDAGQAMYTAFQTSRKTEFDAAVADLAAQCRNLD